MCLIVFAYKKHPRYDLILAANRDEAFERPTRAAQFWDDHPTILAGKDLKAGGAWMGINRYGSFAALTNYRDPSIKKENPPSRGNIVTDYLNQQEKPAKFLAALNTDSDRYMGFNLLAGSPEKLFHYSNQERKVNQVKPGVHGLSNHLLDTPWPKVEQAKSGLSSIIEQDEVATDGLFNLMQNDQPASDEKLPDTGVPRDIEKQLSSVFINTEKYGTRCTTILLVENSGAVIFEERRYRPQTSFVEETNRFEFGLTSQKHSSIT